MLMHQAQGYEAFTVSLEVDHARAVIALSGELDLSGATELRQALAAAIAGGPREVVLDCSGLSYLDASGIGLISGARSRLVEDRRALTLRGARATPRRILELCGLEEWLEG